MSEIHAFQWAGSFRKRNFLPFLNIDNILTFHDLLLNSPFSKSKENAKIYKV